MVPDALREGTTITLDEGATRHLRVLRLDVGAVVGVRDGAGSIADTVPVRSNRLG